jgi:hypothetical protein
MIPLMNVTPHGLFPRHGTNAAFPEPLSKASSYQDRGGRTAPKYHPEPFSGRLFWLLVMVLVFRWGDVQSGVAVEEAEWF